MLCEEEYDLVCEWSFQLEIASAVALASHTRLLPGKARQLTSAILCEWLIIAALHVC